MLTEELDLRLEQILSRYVFQTSKLTVRAEMMLNQGFPEGKTNIRTQGACRRPTGALMNHTSQLAGHGWRERKMKRVIRPRRLTRHHNAAGIAAEGGNIFTDPIKCSDEVMQTRVLNIHIGMTQPSKHPEAVGDGDYYHALFSQGVTAVIGLIAPTTRIRATVDEHEYGLW